MGSLFSKIMGTTDVTASAQEEESKKASRGSSNFISGTPPPSPRVVPASMEPSSGPHCSPILALPAELRQKVFKYLPEPEISRAMLNVSEANQASYARFGINQRLVELGNIFERNLSKINSFEKFEKSLKALDEIKTGVEEIKASKPSGLWSFCLTFFLSLLGLKLKPQNLPPQTLASPTLLALKCRAAALLGLQIVYEDLGPAGLEAWLPYAKKIKAETSCTNVRGVLNVDVSDMFNEVLQAAEYTEDFSSFKKLVETFPFMALMRGEKIQNILEKYKIPEDKKLLTRCNLEEYLVEQLGDTLDPKIRSDLEKYAGHKLLNVIDDARHSKDPISEICERADIRLPPTIEHLEYVRKQAQVASNAQLMNSEPILCRDQPSLNTRLTLYQAITHHINGGVNPRTQSPSE